MGKSNPQYQCPGCVHKNSRNQLRGSNGHCIHCKTRMNHNSWWGGSPTLGQILSLPCEDDNALKSIAMAHDLDIKDLIVAAIEAKIAYWLEDGEQVEKRVKQDLMLTKLMRR